MTFDEDDLLPISALQHLLFCERQAALIHVERQWRDNSLTLQGTHLHERVDGSAQRRESRGDLIIVRGLALRSMVLGLVGRADVVEFHRNSRVADPAGAGAALGTSLPGVDGLWHPVPVEYKRGKPKTNRCDEVQLCAQALCLEEQYSLAVPEGALFYGKHQRRKRITFDDELRSLTEQAAARFRELVLGGLTPRAKRTPKCERCSLLDICLPEAMNAGSIQAYLRSAFDHPGASQGESTCDTI